MSKKRTAEKEERAEEEEEEERDCLVTQLEVTPAGKTKWKILFLYFHTDGHWQWLEERERGRKSDREGANKKCVSFWHDLWTTTITYSSIQTKVKKGLKYLRAIQVNFFSWNFKQHQCAMELLLLEYHRTGARRTAQEPRHEEIRIIHPCSSLDMCCRSGSSRDDGYFWTSTALQSSLRHTSVSNQPCQ